MKKAIFCVLVCMLMMLTSVVPISGTIFGKESSQLLIKENTQYVKTEKIFNDLQGKLDKVTTKQEALTLIKEVIAELNNCGLLPKGITVQRAQRLVTGCFLKSELRQPFQRTNENISGNINCLVIGISNETYFRPYPALVMDIPFLHNLAFNHSGPSLTTILALPYLFRELQPLKFGPYVYVGDRFKVVEYGNTTYERVDASSGWVWTIGSNGFKKWNGTFYGGLYTKYQKSVKNNYSYAEAWNPVGIRGFVGINFLSFISSFGGYKLPSFYIGFAKEVNFTYSPPWT
ncbi:MAG: hypothetical protein JW840_03460 [Candidatus Thermoplasmatota archaeon]|nr:hypothetical protein [Candidatus Thermoplasmatota archaeon]